MLITPYRWSPWQSTRILVVLLTWPEVGILAGQAGWGEETSDHAYCGVVGLLWVWKEPFGLINAPVTFQRLMETCLRDLNLQWCIIYLDDIVIFSQDPASHLERLEAVFWKLEEAGLKLKPSKCELFWWQIAYLGHTVSAQGIATDKGKVEVIKKWPVPTNITEIQSSLGFMGYYWQFIPNVCTGSLTPAWVNLGWQWWQEKDVIRWNDRCQQVFDDLKRLCTTAPVLAF